jgi:hypothetical protein
MKGTFVRACMRLHTACIVVQRAVRVFVHTRKDQYTLIRLMKAWYESADSPLLHARRRKEALAAQELHDSQQRLEGAGTLSNKQMASSKELTSALLKVDENTILIL